MPALGTIVGVVAAIILLTGAVYFTWRLEESGALPSVLDAVKSVGNAIQKVAKEEPQKVSLVILVGAAIGLYLLTQD